MIITSYGLVIVSRLFIHLQIFHRNVTLVKSVSTSRINCKYVVNLLVSLRGAEHRSLRLQRACIPRGAGHGSTHYDRHLRLLPGELVEDEQKILRSSRVGFWELEKRSRVGR